eukprot:Rhum_TRINITY_DN12113_c0_g2::Rhum_TRINITY_DN12113_c0_g2_i1::g.49401::m.49401
MVTRVLALLCVCVGASALTRTLTCRGKSYLFVDGLVCPDSTVPISDATLESCMADFCPSFHDWAQVKGGKRMITKGQGRPCTTEPLTSFCKQQICRQPGQSDSGGYGWVVVVAVCGLLFLFILALAVTVGVVQCRKRPVDDSGHELQQFNDVQLVG